MFLAVYPVACCRHLISVLYIPANLSGIRSPMPRVQHLEWLSPETAASAPSVPSTFKGIAIWPRTASTGASCCRSMLDTGGLARERASGEKALEVCRCCKGIWAAMARARMGWEVNGYEPPDVSSKAASTHQRCPERRPMRPPRALSGPPVITSSTIRAKGYTQSELGERIALLTARGNGE
jgi:hypothetical protein